MRSGRAHIVEEARAVSVAMRDGKASGGVEHLGVDVSGMMYALPLRNAMRSEKAAVTNEERARCSAGSSQNGL